MIYLFKRLIKDLRLSLSPLYFFRGICIKTSLSTFYLSICYLTSFLIISCTSETKHIPRENILIGTFNIAWLGDGVDDNISRNEIDYKRIADVIDASGVDLLGVEEIENPVAIEKVMKYLPDFKYYLSNSGGKQNVGIICRKDIVLTDTKDYFPLVVESDKTRPGIIANVKSGSFDFLMMVIHLKSTSSFDSTDELKFHSYQIRNRQSKVLSDWTDSILSYSKEKDIIIVGDFNDSPQKKNNNITPILENNKLAFLSQDVMSCKFQYSGSIDHIVTSSSVLKRYLKGSIHLYDLYSAYGEKEIECISDHCPMIATFNISAHDND